MDGITKQDFEAYNKSLLDKLDKQNDTLDKIIDELKKANETTERLEKERKEEKQQEQQKDQEQEKNNTQNEILAELKKISLKTSEEKTTEADEKLVKVLTIVEKNYDKIEMQTNLVIAYGVLFIPAILLFVYLNNLFKEFY